MRVSFPVVAASMLFALVPSNLPGSRKNAAAGPLGVSATISHRIESCDEFIHDNTEIKGTIALSGAIRCRTPKVLHVMTEDVVILSTRAIQTQGLHFVVHPDSSLFFVASDAMAFARNKDTPWFLFVVFGQVFFDAGGSIVYGKGGSMEEQGRMVMLQEGGEIVSGNQFYFTPTAMGVAMMVENMPATSTPGKEGGEEGEGGAGRGGEEVKEGGSGVGQQHPELRDRLEAIHGTGGTTGGYKSVMEHAFIDGKAGTTRITRIYCPDSDKVEIWEVSLEVKPNNLPDGSHRNTENGAESDNTQEDMRVNPPGTESALDMESAQTVTPADAPTPPADDWAPDMPPPLTRRARPSPPPTRGNGLTKFRGGGGGTNSLRYWRSWSRMTRWKPSKGKKSYGA